MTISLTPKHRSQREAPPRASVTLAPRPQPTVRYSRFVGFMRVLLPGLAVALLGVMLVWPKLSGRDELGDLGLPGLTERAMERPTMTNPRYYGVDAGDQPFTVTADLARTLDRDASVIALDGPKASISLRGGAQVRLGADAGTYRQKDQTIDLAGGVVLDDERGYAVRTERARIDLTTSGASGDAPVRGEGPFGVLEAQGFTMSEEGRTIHFTGKSRAVLQPGSGSRP